MCNISHVKMSILMQGKISNIYRKKKFQDRNTIPKVYLHLSILYHNRIILTILTIDNSY